MKKSVLMICSWLDVEKGTGLFFWEQAGFMRNDFNFILCHFKRKYVGPKSLHNLFKIRIVKRTAPNGIDAYQIDYLYSRYFPKRINQYFHQFYIKKFYRFLRRSNLNIQLIHAQSIFNATIEASYMNEMYGIPYVFTEHNQFSLRGKTHFELEYLKKIISSNYQKLVVSYDKIRQFAANSLFADFEVVGNAVDEALFNYNALNDKSRNESGELAFITMGAYSPIKDQKTILQALDLIDVELKFKVQFTWIGFNCWGKNTEKEVGELVTSYRFKNIKVTLIPLMPREQVAKALQKSDIFLFSSISEGMPVSVLEALACGLPVCTTRCGGVDELIDSTNGEIVQVKDYKAISRFLLKFINKEMTFDRKNISKRILDYYGSKAFGRRMKEIYLDAMSNEL